jgi:hypothetical protein
MHYAMNMFANLRIFYSTHRLFCLIFLLFISFRLLAVMLFRPGGFIADFSDYDFYMEWARLTAKGYQTYDNLWTAYPPLFPALMQGVFNLSARIPPWVDPRLFFHTLLGSSLLVFEASNLILIYRLAHKLEPTGREAILPPLLYALFFVPVYTLLGWFEAMPLFFMLLGLDMLLSRSQPWNWLGSALVAALGFLTKLTPALLVPVAVRWLGAKLDLQAVREEWFNLRSPANLLRPTLYVLFFLGTVIVVGYPFVRANPALALSSFRVQSIRPPWQSLWAVLDGYFGYGLVPLDMRNLAGLNGPLWESRLPWPLITLGFILLYLWLYTRPYDWSKLRTPVAFTAASVIWLFLYSKGWSPQFLVWVLAFTALLLPTLRGVAIAIVLMVTNFVETNVFLILLPAEHWILWGTVIIRTVLLSLLAVDFLGQIWPSRHGITLLRISSALAWTAVTLSIVAMLVGAPPAAQAYTARRLAEHPCRQTIAYLEEEAAWPGDLVVTAQIEAWESLYPWLREKYHLHVIDGYSPHQDPIEVGSARLATLVKDKAEFWWLTMATNDEISSSFQSQISKLFFADPKVQVIETKNFGACTLSRVTQIPAQPIAIADVVGGPIELLQISLDEIETGSTLYLVLYWRTRSPTPERYTVFTQLISPSEQIIAQQDNWPVRGLAPTDTWQPGIIVRDPYFLPIPADAEAGHYRLLIGLYTSEGRRPLKLSDSRRQDFVEIPVQIRK